MNELIHCSYKVTLEIIGYPKYVVANKKIYNRKTGKELKPKLYQGIIGYNLNSKFVPYKKLKFKKPENWDCPF